MIGLLRYTLVSDGSSDQVLMPILKWLLINSLPQWELEGNWAELRHLRRTPPALSGKIQKSVELYPCDLLFVHRDAENQESALRVEEVRVALQQASIGVPAVCIIPVRMQEAWLLIDEQAIRNASGNANGKQKLDMPKLRSLESIADPKTLLYNLLREASGLKGRRRDTFPLTTAARLVSEHITDFTPLRQLSAFQAFEAALHTLLVTNGWLNTEN